MRPVPERAVPEELARRYGAEGFWNDDTLGAVVERHLATQSSLTFKVWSGTRPFEGMVGEVHETARRLAGALHARGVGPGDVVAFQLPNWVEAAAVFWGASLLGAVLVPIVHFYGAKEVGYILEQSGARALVTADRFGHNDYLATLEELRPRLPALETVLVVGDDFDEVVGAADPLPELLATDPDAAAVIAYTSGTTSDPKGVVHTHRSLGAEVRQLGDMRSSGDNPMLVGAPVGHAIGMLSGLLLPLHRHHPVHLIDVWDPATVLKAMAEAGLNAGSGATFFLLSLLDHPDCGPEHRALMHHVGLGGMPVPAAVADRAESLGISVVRSYGSTEHPSITGAMHEDPPEKRKYTDGRALPGVEVRLAEDGEILSRGPDLFLGYTDPALTAAAIDAEGWYHTGDVGVMDDEGWLTITDRKADVIIRGGENVSAAEVEGLLVRMDGVAEVAVVAAPDARLGEHACAFVRGEAPSLDAVRSHLEAAGLARQKWPEEIREVADFPRTASGKVKKFELRRLLREEAQ